MNLLHKTFLTTLLSAPVYAEVITDGSLGTANTLIGPDFQITADLGQQRGGNLFHSFSQFSIAAGESATFTGPAEIANILSRVTGGDSSTIDGLLRSDIDGADLFLLNPAGVMFGANASVDISGSLHVSTGDYLVLDDLTQFMAVPQVGEVLSTAAPTAFGFLSPSAGAIQFQGADLTLSSGNTMTLAANGIQLNNTDLTIDQGAVQMASLASAGEVAINTGVVSGATGYGDINLVDSDVTLDGVGGGSVFIEGGDILLDGSSDIAAETQGDIDGKDFIIRAAGTLSLAAGDITTTTTDTVQGGDGGDIFINAGDITITAGGEVEAFTFGSGNAGKITLQTNNLLIAREGTTLTTGVRSDARSDSTGHAGGVSLQATGIELLDSGTIRSNTFGQGDAGMVQVDTDRLLIDDAFLSVNTTSSATGNGGKLVINASDIEVRNTGQITASTSGQGNGGFIDITTDHLIISRDGAASFTAVVSDASDGSTGHAGGVSIQATDIQLLDSGVLGSRTFGEGDAGMVAVVTDRLLLDDAFLSVNTTSSATGNGGNLVINADDIELRNTGKITANTSGQGNAGAVQVATARLLIDDAFLESEVGSSATGNGGNLVINASNIEVRNTGEITASTSGQGNAGVVEIATDSLLLDDGTVASRADSSSTGNGGNLLINAGAIEVRNTGAISATVFSESQGNAGFIDITTGHLIVLGNGASSFTGIASDANSDSSGNAGGVSIQATDIELFNNGFITSRTFSEGDAGEVEIETDRLLVDDAFVTSSVIGSSATGNGGNLVINAGAIAVRNTGQILAATSGQGNAGSIDITTNHLMISGDGAPSDSVTGIRSDANSGSTGHAGEISIQATSMELLANGTVRSSTFSEGDAGVVQVAADRLLIDDAFLSSTANSSATGNGGNLVVNASDIEVRNTGEIRAITFGQGNAGAIDITTDHLTVAGNGASSFTAVVSDAGRGSSGDAGRVSIQANDIELFNNGFITSRTFSEGDAGVVELETDRLLVDDAFVTSSVIGSSATGNGGNLVINAGDVVVRNTGQILAATSGQGSGGLIELTADHLMISGDGTPADSVTGIRSDANSGSTGDAGEVSIQATAIELLSGGKIQSSTFGRGDAGFVRLKADQLLVDSMSADRDTGIFSSAGSGSTGNAGNLAINARALTVRQFGSIDTSTEAAGHAGSITIESAAMTLTENGTISSRSTGTGRAGSIEITVAENINLSEFTISTETIDGFDPEQPALIKIAARNLLLDQSSRISAQALGVADAGTVEILGETLTMTNNSFIDSANSGTGRAGIVKITVSGDITISDSTIGSETSNREGDGNAGSIEILANGMTLNRGIISSASRGNGRAGSVEIDVATDIRLNDFLISTETVDGFDPEQPASISITAENLLLDQASRISADTFGLADAGNVSLQIDDGIQIINGGKVSSITETGTTGNAGNIDIEAGAMTLNSGVISSESLGSGRAGSVDIDVAGDISLNDFLISTETIDGFDPRQPASIKLTGQNLLLDQSSAISTNAFGESADAGDIDLTVADSIRVLGGSRFSTESTGGGGGQITVLTDELLYLRDSAITTSVARGAGNGGDIFVDPVFILLDNSEIIANAFAGNGGNITLIADYILQSIDSQISASSQLGIDGEINIQALDTDVDTGEDNLSADFLNVENWVQQACFERSLSGFSSFILNRPNPRPSPYDDWTGSPISF